MRSSSQQQEAKPSDGGVLSTLEVQSRSSRKKKKKNNDVFMNDGDHEGGTAGGGAESIDLDADDEVIIIRTTRKKIKEYEDKVSREIHTLNQVPKSLGTLSIAAGLFQFLQTIFLILFAASNRRFTWYLYTNYSTPEERQPIPNQIAAFSVLWYGPVSTCLSGMEHLACIFFRSTYVYYLERCQNPYRWMEYTFSASIMRVLIAQVVGVTDIHLIFSIFILTVITIQCGMSHEFFNAKARADGFPVQWRLVFMAIVCHLTTYAIIFDYFKNAVALAEFQQNAVWLWPIVILIFLCEATFATVFIFQWAKLEPLGEDYIEGEKAFIVLSFITKTLLAWLSVAAFR